MSNAAGSRRLRAVSDSEPAFRSIGEAAVELGLKPHVLRYWETRFEQLSPMKRADGRRYYRPEDMDVLRRLQDLLHVQGMTLRGAAKFLADHPAVETTSLTDAGPISAAEPAWTSETSLASAIRLGKSVGELQAMVRSAVARGEFGEAILEENDNARERLESLLSRLKELKGRVDGALSLSAA